MPSRVSSRLCSKTSAHDGAGHAADDGSGHEIGQPMESDRDAEADVERVECSQKYQQPVFGIERDEAGRHRKGDGGMRRWPAPEHAAFEETELESVAAVHQRTVVCRRHSKASEWRREASGEGLVTAGNQIAEQGRLAQGPGLRDEPAVFASLDRKSTR